MELKDWLAKKLPQQSAIPQKLSGYTAAAVLVPLFKKGRNYHLLYTQRSQTVRDHKGQISFPGGMKERKDRDLRITALRETEEEIGIKPSGIQILGQLGELFTPTRYHVVPYVGIIDYPYPFRYNPQEIDRLIEVPLNHLMKPENFRSERAEFFDRHFDYPFFIYRGDTIWGATGRITRELVGLLKKWKPG